MHLYINKNSIGVDVSNMQAVNIILWLKQVICYDVNSLIVGTKVLQEPDGLWIHFFAYDD